MRRWYKAEGALLLPVPIDAFDHPFDRNETEKIETFWLRMKVELIRTAHNTPIFITHWLSLCVYA